jgi:hypothetical protein
VIRGCWKSKIPDKVSYYQSFLFFYFKNIPYICSVKRNNMGYKNDKGENEYLFGWLTANPNSNEFHPTSGGNSVWAKTKREAIAKVNQERKQWEKENPQSWKLRVNPDNCRIAKTFKESMEFDKALYNLTV